MTEDKIYDLLVIELQKDGKSVGSISIQRKDIDTMVQLHDQTIDTIVGDMVKTLEDGIRERS
jgi:hypothetical protein